MKNTKPRPNPGSPISTRYKGQVSGKRKSAAKKPVTKKPVIKNK